MRISDWSSDVCSSDLSAAISIGRMEIPVHVVDGLAAALTYDDPMPEEPFDKNGNGLDDDGRSLELPKLVQVVPIRNGQDALIPTPGDRKSTRLNSSH